MKIAVILIGVLVATVTAVHEEVHGSTAETFKEPESKGNTPAGNMDIGSILKNVDIGSVMKNIDLGAMGDMLKGVDIQGMMKNMDVGAMDKIMKNVDINGIMKNMDVGAIEGIMKNVDVGSIMKNVDFSKMGDIIKNVDINGLMKNMDLGPIGDIVKNVDIGSMMKNIDMNAITGMMKNIDLGGMMGKLKDMDLPKMVDEAKEHIPDIDTLINMKNIAWEFLEKKGIPVNDPKEFLNFVRDKLNSLPLPQNLDADTLLNMAHEELQDMGFPEDPAKIKEWLMEQAGLVGIKDIEDLKKPEVLSQVMTKKALRMMDIDENEDPHKVKDRIQEQLIEEANKLGASLTKDSTTEEIMTQIDKVLSQHVNEIFGIETDSLHPSSLHNATMKQLSKMGIPVHDFSATKKHVIDLAMKGLMESVTPMIMNLFLGGGNQHAQSQPMMQQPMMQPFVPQMMPINLDISVNVEQPEHQRQMPTMPYLQPNNINGAEPMLHYSKIESMNDQELYHHIMAVRHSLMTGEMSEELLQELIKDLMNARWRNRVLAVKNMFMRDHIASLENDMYMVSQMKMMELPELVTHKELSRIRNMQSNGHTMHEDSKASMNSQEEEEESKESTEFRDSLDSTEIRNEHNGLRNAKHMGHHKSLNDSIKMREEHKSKTPKRDHFLHSLLTKSRIL